MLIILIKKPVSLFIFKICTFVSQSLVMYSEKGQQTKDHFIKTSARLFNTKGYAGTSISDILNDAGYSKGALYRVFKDKDELAVEAFNYNLGIMKSLLRDEVYNTLDDIDRILAIPRFYASINDTKSFLEGGCPVLNTATEADDTHPRLKAMVRKAFIDMAMLIEQTIEQAKKNNRVKATVSARELSHFMVATIEGSIAMMQSMDSDAVIKNNMKYLEKTVKSML